LGAAVLIITIAATAGAAVGGVVSVLVIVGLTIERVNAYYDLPEIRRRKNLTLKSRALNAEIAAATDKKNSAELKLRATIQQENAEKASELKRIQEQVRVTSLSSIPISRLDRLSGIGPGIINNYRAAGIHNARDLAVRGPYVKGVGSKKGAQVRAQLQEWETSLRRQIPNALPKDIEQRLSDKWRSQKQPIVNDVDAATRQISRQNAELRNTEVELRNLRVPTFGTFLRRLF
jgi:hypothetical protein